ncbi:MAG: DUF4398 domain-containing protein, partial [Proteobacteria bacterium]
MSIIQTRITTVIQEKGSPRRLLLFFGLMLTVMTLSNCASITTTRPVQEMADTVAALKAAREVGADSVAPELYRQAIESYTKARNDYRFKNFASAKRSALRAKKLAEEAEYQAILKGQNRSSLIPVEEPPPPPNGDSGSGPSTSSGPEFRQLTLNLSRPCPKV